LQYFSTAVLRPWNEVNKFESQRPGESRVKMAKLFEEMLQNN